MSIARREAPRLARPATRYWKGKAPKGVADAASDSSDSDESPQPPGEAGDIPFAGDQDVLEDGGGIPIHAQVVKGMNIALKDVNIKDGKVIVAGREESGKTAMEEDEFEEDNSEDGQKSHLSASKLESDGQSSEYESDSEEEDQMPKLQFRPVFVPKRGRVTILEKEAIAHDTEEALKRKELEAEERKKQSHDLVAESIKRELAEKEKEEIIPDVDDTDGLDPAADFEAWRLRELGRIKKEKEEEAQREEEREEIERRHALPEEQRLKEDLERAEKLRNEKPKGSQKFLQKYWHKGAFHQDEEILKRHDFTEATESTVDVSLLPQVMQVKNFGKRSRTKYTHLLDQDTTVKSGGFGGTAPVKAGGKSTEGGGCFLCGGPHLKKDCPQNIGTLSNRGSFGSGANVVPQGPRNAQMEPRQWEANREPSSWRDRGDDRDVDNGHDDRRRDKVLNGRRHDGRRERKDEVGIDDRDTQRGPRTRSRSRSPSRRSNVKRNECRERHRSRSRERAYSDEYGEKKEKRRRLD